MMVGGLQKKRLGNMKNNKPYTGQIPFDKDGSLIRYAYPQNYPQSPQIIWKDNYIFKEVLTFEGFGRGRSAAYAVFRGQHSQTYTMFVTDLSDLLSRGNDSHTNTIIKGTFWAEWTFCKRGSNYGIKMVV
jgi:hypothetical protein